MSKRTVKRLLKDANVKHAIKIEVRKIMRHNMVDPFLDGNFWDYQYLKELDATENEITNLIMELLYGEKIK